MSHYKFHPETWTDAQSQELCNQWYQEASFDKQSIKNPATKRKIQRGKARWDNIHRYCNKTVRKRFPGWFKQFEVETPTPLVLPDTTNLHKEIREIVKLWDTSNPLLDKISGYCPKHAGDCPALFPSTEDTSLLCLEEKKEEWTEESERFRGTDEKETKKELNGIATDFVTLYFLGTVETRLQFINLVVTTFDLFLSELKDHDPHLFSQKNIILLFKGGVSLRLILRDLLKNFSGDLEQIIVYKLRKYIKISDYDFEIVSRKDLFDLNKNTKFNVMTYLVVVALRNYLLSNKLKFFNFFRLKTSEQQEKVGELKKNLQTHINNIKNPNNPYYNVTIEHLQYGGDCADLSSGQFDTDLTPKKRRDLRNFPPKRGDFTSPCRTDFAVVVNPTVMTRQDSVCFVTAKNLLKAYEIKNDTLLNLPLRSRNQGSRFYATHNPLISAKVGTGVEIMFNLNRIKYDFTLYCKKDDDNLFRDSVVGEILDLSHAGRADRRKSPADVMPSPLRRRYKFFGYNLGFTSYSLEGFYFDLTAMIFKETQWEPWTEAKYTKRLYRLISVSILHFFSVDLKENLTFLERLQYLDAFIEVLQKPLPAPPDGPDDGFGNCPSASGDEPEDGDPEEGKYPVEPPRCGKERCPRVYAYRKKSGSGNLFENFAENIEKVRVKAVEKGIRGCEVYGDFINATLLIFTEIQEVLRAEYQLSRDPRFSVGSLYPLDLAIEFPAAYW